MCAILDNDAVHQVFGVNRPAAGRAFFEWIDSGRGRLVVGGRLRRELDGNHAFRNWRRQAVLAGQITLLNHAILSDRSFAGEEYRWLEIVRRELGEWCTHYLDPALAMRAPRSPADVFDIGSYGEDIAPFLYKLRAEEPGRFRAVSHATAIAPFDATGPWFKDSEIAAALTSQAEDGLFENLMMRGLIDE